MSAAGFRIEVPETYFARSAAKDYSDDVGLALVREFAQNAADAGATRVEFAFLGDNQLRVTDNGRGCDARTVRQVLLAPLGTLKEADAIGGFGKAKELLYFANASWNIRTRDVLARGAFLTCEQFAVGCEPFAGFEAVVTLPAPLWRAARNSASNFCRCSERPGVTWVLDGVERSPEVRRPARAQKDFAFAKAYIDRASHDSVVYLRTGGLLTGTRWGYHSRDLGRVVIEVTKPSFEVLTPSRDWFRDGEHRRAVEGWLHELAVNQRAALAEELGDEILFHDFETVVAEPTGQALAEVVPTTSGVQAPVRFTAPAATAPLSTSAVEQALTALGSAEAHGTRTQDSSPAKAQRVKPQGFHIGLLPRIEGLRSVVAHTGGTAQAKVAAKWLAKNGAQAAQVLAAFATAASIVCQRSGTPFDAIGFTFKEGTEAEFIRSRGRHAFLVNPLTFDPRANDAVEELLDRALHEVAHYTQSNHDEAFVLAEVALRRKSRGAAVRGPVARALRTARVEAEEGL